MARNIILNISMALFAMTSQAGEVEKPEPELIQSLQDDMQQYSSIATRTRQNVDYMPYIISTLDADELLGLGINTLREALGLVPGIDLSINTVGTTVPIFRGSNPFAVGQSKLVLDGMVLNDKMTGGYNQVLDMPLQLIQRIEVVRGPGSLLSHINGYSGSIHVITRANRDDGLAVNSQIFAESGSSDYRNGGFVASYREGNLSVSSDLYYKRHDQELPVTVDRYGISGNSQQWLDNYNFGINARYNNLSIKGRLSDRDNGPSYGQAFSLSEEPSDYVSLENNLINIEYLFEISKDTKIELSLGYVELIRELQNKVIPDGTVFPNGRLFEVRIGEETSHERIELKTSAFDSHQINLGIYAYQNKMTDRQGTTTDVTVDVFDILYDAPRDMHSVYFDDLIDFTEQTSMQIGIKYDHYSDVDSQASPRIALVHRHDNNNIYKFMYTQSYREPAWREQYLTRPAFFSSTPDIKPELVDAYELGYIHKIGLNSHLKLNAYYLNNQDQIHAQSPAPPNTFQNNGNNNLHGFEIEYKNTLKNSDEFYFNYSFVDGENVANRLANSAHITANAYYSHNLGNNFKISGITKYTGKKERTETDNRPDVEDYTLFNLSLDYAHNPDNINLNISIKNLFDKSYTLPSPANTYPDDFIQEGRSFLISLRKKF